MQLAEQPAIHLVQQPARTGKGQCVTSPCFLRNFGTLHLQFALYFAGYYRQHGAMLTDAAWLVTARGPRGVFTGCPHYDEESSSP